MHKRKIPNCFGLARYTPYLLAESRANDTLDFRLTAGASWLELAVTGPPWHKVANQCQSGPPLAQGDVTIFSRRGWHQLAINGIKTLSSSI